MNQADRVRSFLDSWPMVEKHLNEILQEGIKDGNDIFNGSGSGNHAEAQPTHSLQALEEKERDSGS
jgi:hypothetical protein